jgi:hypothetical protein
MHEARDMNDSFRFLFFCTMLFGFASPASADELPTKPTLEVSEDFWPPVSQQHTIYAMTSFWPFAPERRWIGYADGEQITEIQFHEIAGLDEEVARLKRRKRTATVAVAGGFAGAILGAMTLSTAVLSEAQSPNGALLAGGGVLGFAGITAGFIGTNMVWFRGTTRKQAHAIADKHNQKP